MQKLEPWETQLVGEWTFQGSHVTGNAAADRINALVAGWLRKEGSTDGGWTVLYQDPNDGRFWELTYPHGDWHGGGPPTLTHISDATARERYHLP